MAKQKEEAASTLAAKTEKTTLYLDGKPEEFEAKHAERILDLQERTGLRPYSAEKPDSDSQTPESPNG